MTKKYQVFVSSTYQDLKEERDQVIKAILEMGHIPVGMEMFSAADDEQWKIIARQIDDIDYYVIIVAHRYGSVDGSGISYTEKEYDYATKKGIPILGFVIDDSAPWPADRLETDSKSKKKLNDFKRKVKSKIIQFWKNKEELHGRFSIALMKSITTNPRTGWVKASEAAGPEVMKELTRLSGENATLRTEIDAMKRATDGHIDEVRAVIKILSSNKKTFSVRRSAKWEDAKKNTSTLADLFNFCAPNLIDENTNKRIAENIALRTIDVKYHTPWPVGSNIVSEMLADFAALNLIEPSKKKHPVSDKESYWTLTKLGKKVHADYRRVRLEEGLASTEETTPGEAANPV